MGPLGMKVDQAKPQADGLLWKQIWGLRQPEPSLSFAVARPVGWAPAAAGFGLACMACCTDGP